MAVNRFKVLAIDDKADNLVTLSAVLKDVFHDASVLTALDGARGLAIAGAEIPDIILLDIVMPGMDGFEVCRRLKVDDRLKDIPVVFLTAMETDQAARIKALEVGAEGFMTKPLNETELAAQIRAMLKINEANGYKKREKERLAALVAERTRDLEQELAQRRIAEEALSANEERLRAILQTAMDGFWMADMAGHLIMVNDAFQKMSGYSAPELLNMNIADFAAADSTAEISSHIFKVIQQGEDRFESRYRSQNGSVFDVEISIKYGNNQGGRLVCFLRDITARKKAIEALQESVIFNSELMKNTPYPMFVGNADSSIRFVNPAFEALTGFSNAELTGKKPPYPWWPHNSIMEFIAEDLKSKESDHFFTNIERLYRKKNGETLWIVINSRYIKTGHGSDFFIAAWQDVTERKIAEMKLERSYQKEKNQRRELQEEAKARGMFIDILGHELRTPLTPLTACSEMLREIYCSRDEGIEKSLVENLWKSSNTLGRRLEELLDLAKFSRGTFTLQKQPVNIRDLANKIVVQFQPMAEQQLKQLTSEIQDGLPLLEADPSRLEQVLTNLLSNAIKYSPNHTRITLRVKKSDSHIIIEVQDEGIGISPQEQQEIFKPYHRVAQDSQKYPGIGLGLAVSDQIVKAHGGRINIESETNKGSTFIVQLPLNMTQGSLNLKPEDSNETTSG